MNLIRDLMEYGELRLWNCDRWVYAELHLEISADGCKLIAVKADDLELALWEAWYQLMKLRKPTASQDSHSRGSSSIEPHRNGEQSNARHT